MSNGLKQWWNPSIGELSVWLEEKMCTVAKDAYISGQIAEREECAELAEKVYLPSKTNGFKIAGEIIASGIRGRNKEEA